MCETKVCAGCGRELPLSEFNKLRRRADGHQSRCRRCFSEYNRKRYAANPERFRSDVRRYRAENPGSELETRVRACEKKPTRRNAYRAVDAAIRAGVLVKPRACSICGCPDSEHRIEAHHHDYARPLDVVWLCTPCHVVADSRRRVRNGQPPHSVARAVLMMRDGETLCRFDSIEDAAKAVDRASSSISQCLAGRSRTSAGFEWSYASE